MFRKYWILCYGFHKFSTELPSLSLNVYPMKTLLVYESTHGCTEKCSSRLNELLKAETDVVRLKRLGRPSIRKYHTIVIGGSIHAGMMQSRVRKFCEDYLDILMHKKIGLFVCCMEEGEKAKEQFENAFPDKLKEHAIAKGIFGGEFNFERMNFFQKAIVRKVKGISETVSRIDHEEIERFAATLNAQMYRKKDK